MTRSEATLTLCDGLLDMNYWKTNLIGIVLMFATLCGCQSLTTTAEAPRDVPADKIAVQIRPAGKKPRNIQLPLKPDLRLQEVINASKAGFRQKTAYVVRTSPKTGERHKLVASFGANRRVSLETDYALQPGDRVVIAQDTTSSFDKVMKSMLGRT